MPRTRLQNNFDISHLTVRRASQDDYPQIMRCVAEAKLPTAENVYTTPFLVARYSGELVGVVGYLKEADGWAYVRSLAVNHAYRKCGIGAQLLQSLIELLMGDNDTKLLIAMSMYWNNRFYKHFGFERMDPSAKQHDAVARQPENHHCTCWGMEIPQG